MKILIVDDYPQNRMLLAAMLSQYGHCDLAINGVEAVESFEYAIEDGEPYSLVCLDIMMPEMDGQEALRRMRQLEDEKGLNGSKTSTIFMISALDVESLVVKACFRCGCTDYLAKPITRYKLLGKMREYHLLADLPACYPRGAAVCFSTGNEDVGH
ncbi:MAG: response regulator [Magnetococcus sp. YQC-5]